MDCRGHARRFAAAYVVLSAIALASLAGTGWLVLHPPHHAPSVTVAEVIAAFESQGIVLQPSGTTAAGTTFLGEPVTHDGRMGLFVTVVGPGSKAAETLARHRLPRSTRAIRFQELQVANVYVRSADVRRNGDGDTAVLRAVAALG